MSSSKTWGPVGGDERPPGKKRRVGFSVAWGSGGHEMAPTGKLR